MNDEIKEILDRLKDDRQMVSYCYYRIFKDDRDKLLDYITNLQNKIETYELFDNQKITKLQEEKEDYKSRNEKAIEYVNTHKPSDTISFPLMKKDEENQVKSCFDYEFREIYQKELLDILQGSDKE